MVFFCAYCMGGGREKPCSAKHFHFSASLIYTCQNSLNIRSQNQVCFEEKRWFTEPYSLENMHNVWSRDVFSACITQPFFHAGHRHFHDPRRVHPQDAQRRVGVISLQSRSSVTPSSDPETRTLQLRPHVCSAVTIWDWEREPTISFIYSHAFAFSEE